MARKRAPLSASDIALLQPLCEFDLSAKKLERPRHIIASHAHAFIREHGIDMRTADLGISYRLDESEDRPEVIFFATGHSKAPIHVEFGSSKSYSTNQHHWIKTIAERHKDCERIIAAGHDPASPPASLVISDPCIGRALRVADTTPEEFLSTIPAVGEVVLGRGWKIGATTARVIELNDLRMHIVRDVAHIRLVKLAVGNGAYVPPDRYQRSQVGILTMPRTTLPQILQDGLKSQPLSRLIDSPLLPPTMTIRSAKASGGSLVVRLDGCGIEGPLA